MKMDRSSKNRKNPFSRSVAKEATKKIDLNYLLAEERMDSSCLVFGEVRPFWEKT